MTSRWPRPASSSTRPRAARRRSPSPGSRATPTDEIVKLRKELRRRRAVRKLLDDLLQQLRALGVGAVARADATHRAVGVRRTEQPVITIGVDPGMTGAIAYVSGGKLLDVVDMPAVGGDISTALLTQMVRMHPVDGVPSSKVWAAPTQGRKQGAQSSFKFGMALRHGALGAVGGAARADGGADTAGVEEDLRSQRRQGEVAGAGTEAVPGPRRAVQEQEQSRAAPRRRSIALWCERLHQAANYAHPDGAPERLPRLRLRLRDSDRQRLARAALAR